MAIKLDPLNICASGKVVIQLGDEKEIRTYLSDPAVSSGSKPILLVASSNIFMSSKTVSSLDWDD